MADKPSRALILYGDGLARFIEPSHIHLHSLASLANCGFLSLPNAPPSESEDKRTVREFAVLLDASEAYLSKNGERSIEGESQQPSLVSTLPERFMGMRAALLTNNSSLKSFGEGIGFSVWQLNELPVDNVASELGKLLGFQEGKVLEVSQFDLVLVHVGGGGDTDVNEGKTTAAGIEFVNALVGGILHLAEHGTEIGSRLHMSLVMSYGHVFKDDTKLLALSGKDNNNSLISAFFPRQSYTMRGENPRNAVRHHSPMLIAQWQYGVTRKDEAQTYCYEDFEQHSGNLTIPADRFLHEIAFKLWKAPKYGA